MVSFLNGFFSVVKFRKSRYIKRNVVMIVNFECKFLRFWRIYRGMINIIVVVVKIVKELNVWKVDLLIMYIDC